MFSPRFVRSLAGLLLLLAASAAPAAGDPMSEVDRAIRLRDYPKAVRLLEPLARAGSAEARYRLANLYRSGQGVSRDADKAIELYRQAAEADLAEAQYALGVMLLGRKQHDDARHWLSAAADQGMDKARRKLTQLERQESQPAASETTDDTTLFALVAANDLDALQRLARRGVSMDRRDSDGRNPLMVALRSGHRELAAWLIERTQQINLADRHGVTALHLAARQDYDDLVDRLLARQANPNAQDNSGATPLHIATRHQRTRIMSALLARGADPKRANKKGQSPLQLAAQLKLEKALALYRQNGLKPQERSQRLTATDLDSFRKSIRKQKKGLYQGWPLISIASLLGETRILTQLLDRGEDLNATDREGNTALHRAAGKGQMKSLRILLDRGIDIDHRNRKGQTALFIAALNGQKAAVRALLKRGADSRMADNKGITPLLAALRGNHHELALELADHPASDRSRYQALILAIQKRQQKLALKLLDTKIPLRLMRPDKRGRSLLWLAADQGMPALVKRLAAQNPDLVDRPDRSGYTPLARAVKRGFVTTASLLIDLGARLDTVTAEGNSLPILAVLSGKPDMLQRILAHEPALNIRNNHGDTAIMLAASAGNERMVSLLIEAGADLQMRNSANQNAEQLARKNGHRKVAEMIRARKPALLRLFE